MGERKPSTAPQGSRTIYYPGGAPQFEYTAANLKNKSHTISAEVEIPAGGAEGVLMAHGSWFAGYTLYVKAARLIYVHNWLGMAEYRIASTEVVTPGKMTLRFVFTRTGDHKGIGRLYFDDRLVGEGELPRMVPAVIETSGEGLCCGYDSGLPVTDDYQAPFRFTGRIRRVVVDIGESAPPDRAAELRAVMTDH